jgi:hypothetical protein
LTLSRDNAVYGIVRSAGNATESTTSSISHGTYDVAGKAEGIFKNTRGSTDSRIYRGKYTAYESETTSIAANHVILLDS